MLGLLSVYSVRFAISDSKNLCAEVRWKNDITIHLTPDAAYECGCTAKT